jgi:hypothetical protein
VRRGPSGSASYQNGDAAGAAGSPGNPKSIRSVEDLARKDVRVVNRERGSGARQLLDRRLAEAGIPSGKVAGYDSVLRLIVPKDLADEHPNVQRLLDALSTRAVRRELDALGGYDTTHTGEVVEHWKGAPDASSIRPTERARSQIARAAPKRKARNQGRTQKPGEIS